LLSVVAARAQLGSQRSSGSRQPRLHGAAAGRPRSVAE
jgi:hypothetical protein